MPDRPFPMLREFRAGGLTLGTMPSDQRVWACSRGRPSVVLYSIGGRMMDTPYCPSCVSSGSSEPSLVKLPYVDLVTRHCATLPQLV